MNNYIQKVDKVGTDEVFPYPIKLTYDNEYIYLTVLRIPEYYELKENKFAMNAVNLITNKHGISSFYSDLCNSESVYLSHLWLCVETLDTSNKHYKSRKRHLSTGRKYVCCSCNNRFNNVSINTTYTIPIISCLTLFQRLMLERYGNAYLTVRGTFRYGGSIFSTCGRTGIFSNKVKILYTE